MHLRRIPTGPGKPFQDFVAQNRLLIYDTDCDANFPFRPAGRSLLPFRASPKRIRMIFRTILATVSIEYLFQILLMILLLCCSAFFSGSETAFFHLSRKTIRQFSCSELRLEQLVSKIVKDPNRFLTALLFGNMAVNILFFSISSTLIFRVSRAYGPVAATVAGAGCFFVLLLFGEMLPKSIAFVNTKRFCLIASPACYFLLSFLRPLLKAIDILFVQTAIQLFAPSHKKNAVSMKQLSVLLDSSRRQGLIDNDESQLLTEILKF